MKNILLTSTAVGLHQVHTLASRRILDAERYSDVGSEDGCSQFIV